MAFSAPLFLLPHRLPLPQMAAPSPRIPKPHPLRCSSSSSAASAASFDLKGYWSSLISEIESALSAAIPVRYPPRIFEAMRYAVLSGGAKRATPIMCVATCELAGGRDLRPAAFPTACALEMVHAASLVHDDLPCFDAAPLRRGRPSTHAAFGVDLAVLAGDALFPLAISHVAATTPPGLVPPERLLRALAEIARAVGSTGMAAGQFLDLTGAADGHSEAEILAILELKFGEMGECSAVCGGVLAGATDEEIAALRRYGRSVGVLYQLVDDIQMVEQEGIGSNGRQGKMRSNASVVTALGMERAMELVEELRAKAKRELQLFDKHGERVLPLYSFVDYAVERGFVVESEGVAAPAVACGDTSDLVGDNGSSS